MLENLVFSPLREVCLFTPFSGSGTVNRSRRFAPEHYLAYWAF